ncbi:MAG: hypothetical protein NT037_18805 [Hyphomicrobiales bacterium]|nr:hypothetical protein [Hyphomicrobiales bacterium]
MSNTLTHSMPAEDIACWIAEIECEYPTLPYGERQIARKQLHQLRAELGIRNEFDRIETKQRYFTAVEAYAATPRLPRRTGLLAVLHQATAASGASIDRKGV